MLIDNRRKLTQFNAAWCFEFYMSAVSNCLPSVVIGVAVTCQNAAFVQAVALCLPPQ